MKTIFLLFGLFGCYGVSAQQKDLFDIEKHLHKKSIQKKGTKHRLLQRDNFNNYKSVPEKNPANKSYTGVLSYTLPNGDKLYSLPTDNMPCVVPDMNQYNIMPNAGTSTIVILQNRPGIIPNPAKPFKIPATK